MEARVDSFPWLTVLITVIVIVLFSSAGFARMMGWGPDLGGSWGEVPDFDRVIPATASGALAGPRCPECGVIVSTGSSEIVVRMADGSSRVIEQADPARWRAGQRLIVIAGADASPQ